MFSLAANSLSTSVSKSRVERWSKGALSAQLSQQLGCHVRNEEAELPFRVTCIR